MTEPRHIGEQPRLPDPRHWNGAADHPLLRLVQASRSGDHAARTRLLDELHALIRNGDAEIFAALRLVPSQAVYRHLWELTCAAIDLPRADAGPLVARLFAIPLVLVAGAKQNIVVPGIVPDTGEIGALLEAHGAVGVTRNFGLSKSLGSLQALECITPGQVFLWTHDFAASGVPREISAEEIRVEAGQQVHLRFMIGAGIASAAAPSFFETAANIGAWGMPLTRVLARQMAQPGLDLLPIPRPPSAILKAAHAGRAAQLELAFNLFVSNTAREFRTAIGDPTVVVSAHRIGEAAEIRISMSSRLDDTLLEGFCWPLHPLDEFDHIGSIIMSLLRECHIADVQIAEAVFSDEKPAAPPCFIRAVDFDRLACGALPH
ncbi:MAG TPA: hypothetical protein VLT92_09165 [Burkholderiales bacterium]|nr:hypothetical protein [Burkholderiales bacterium]